MFNHVCRYQQWTDNNDCVEKYEKYKNSIKSCLKTVFKLLFSKYEAKYVNIFQLGKPSGEIVIGK